MPETILVVAAKAAFALTERIALLKAAGVTDEIRLASPADARHVTAGRTRGALYVVLDANALTVIAATAIRVSGARYILDIGDDAGSLARGLGMSAATAATRAAVQQTMIATSHHVVVRGRFHVPLINDRHPHTWIPDTVPDWVLERAWPVGNTSMICTFGSTGVPRSGDRTYGWEVVDLLYAEKALTGLIVAHGPGIATLQARAVRRGVTDRLMIIDSQPLPQLLELISTAATLTSVQSFDRAGWVRTTGKLPLGLAAGRTVLSTAAGEASVTLQPAQLSNSYEPDAITADFLKAIREVDHAAVSLQAQTSGAFYGRARWAEIYADLLP